MHLMTSGKRAVAAFEIPRIVLKPVCGSALTTTASTIHGRNFESNLWNQLSVFDH